MGEIQKGDLVRINVDLRFEGRGSGDVKLSYEMGGRLKYVYVSKDIVEAAGDVGSRGEGIGRAVLTPPAIPMYCIKEVVKGQEVFKCEECGFTTHHPIALAGHKRSHKKKGKR